MSRNSRGRTASWLELYLDACLRIAFPSVIRDRSPRTRRGIAMNLALWIVQALLAAAFFAAGWIKLFRPKEKIAANPRLGWANDFTPSQIKLIGLAEVLG